MRLADLAGQDHARGALERALASGKLAHAYLFDGPSGVGKRSAAIGLGLALACPRAPGAGCGTCDTCRRVLGQNHPDVRLIVAETAQILIEQVQQVVALASGRPHEAPARVIIFEDADRMNPAAANCLLKTLEEPAPANHLVLVTAAPDRLLPTIRSRTQRVRFVPVPTSTLVAIATARGIDRARAETAAALAGGSVARALELAAGDADQGLWDTLGQIRNSAAEKSMGSVFQTARALGDKESKEGLPDALDLLARLYRDATAASVGAGDLTLLRERSRDIEALAAPARTPLGLRRLRQAWAAVMESSTNLAANQNAVSVLERLMIEIGPCEKQRAAEAARAP